MDLPNCKKAEIHRGVQETLGFLYFHNKKGLEGDMTNCEESIILGSGREVARDDNF